MTSISEAHDRPPGLKVTVVGGGIGGLVAAIALRKQGHFVEVFEQAELVRGAGYGIHLASNGVALLSRLGIDVQKAGAVPMNAIRYYKHTGELLSTDDRKATAGKWLHQWFLHYRPL